MQKSDLDLDLDFEEKQETLGMDLFSINCDETDLEVVTFTACLGNDVRHLPNGLKGVAEFTRDTSVDDLFTERQDNTFYKFEFKQYQDEFKGNLLSRFLITENSPYQLNDLPNSKCRADVNMMLDMYITGYLACYMSNQGY